MSKMRIYCERPCKVWPNYAVDTHTTWTTQQKAPKTTTGPSKLLPSSITLKLKKIILCMVWHTRQQSQFLNCSAKCRMQSFPKKNTMYFVCERQTGVNPQKTDFWRHPDFWNWALITRTDVLKKPKERGKEMREQRRQLPDRTAHWIEWNWRRGSWYVVEQERTRKENDGKEKQMITKADTTCSRNMSAWPCCSRSRNSEHTLLHGDEHQNMSRRNLNPIFSLISHLKKKTYWWTTKLRLRKRTLTTYRRARKNIGRNY